MANDKTRDAQRKSGGQTVPARRKAPHEKNKPDK